MFKFVLIMSLAYINLASASQESVSVAPDVVVSITEKSLICSADLGVSSEIFQNVVTWTVQPKDLDVSKKFMHCLLTKSGYLTDDGMYKTDAIIDLMKSHKLKDKVKEQLEECDKLSGGDKFETTYLKAECFIKKSPVIFAL